MNGNSSTDSSFMHQKSFIFIIVLWLILALFNINKAFHIDDTFHLEAAKWIQENPLKPMSGYINWKNNPMPLFNSNHPPLYYYFIACTGKFLGYNEISLHLFQSIFTFLAIFYFFKIADVIKKKYAYILTLLFVFNPAFIVNQNLMVDVPLVSLCLMFFYYLIEPNNTKYFIKYSKSALILSIALLIKYTCLPLLLVLVLAILIDKKYKCLVVLLIPIFILALWSLTNIIEFGAIHIFNRPRQPFVWETFRDTYKGFVLCLGSIASFSLMFFIKFKYRINSLIFTIIIVFICLLVFYFSFNSEHILKEVLYYNGIIVLFFVFYEFIQKFVIEKHTQIAKRNAILLLTWLLILSLFIIRYSPFIATRHILLIIPPILFLSADIFDKSDIKINYTIIGIVATFGILLTISDWLYADFYRKKAAEAIIKTPKDNTIWFEGHWGWQWYASKKGMLQYETDSKKIQIGNYIVVPSQVEGPDMRGLSLNIVEKIYNKPNKFTLFSTRNYASFYGSNKDILPWTFNNKPIDTIFIYKIIGISFH